MLVLVSFGLVLLATILLVVGWLNDALALIYLSIGASATAATVLYVAFRRAQPAMESARTAPAARGRDLAQPAPDEAPITVSPAAAPAPPASADAARAREPGPAPASPALRGRGSLLLDLDGGDDEFPFPIADYDGLRESQIVPLLAQLEADELDEVRARELAGAKRQSIVDEIDRRRS